VSSAATASAVSGATNQVRQVGSGITQPMVVFMVRDW
jgi:hypothetical protein